MRTSSSASVAIILGLLILQACTVAHYQLRNKLEDVRLNDPKPCNFTYSLVIASGSHTNTFGTRDLQSEALLEIRNEYIAATEEALRESGCTVTYVESDDEANLKVRVERLHQLSALPQEWLTGLSFGLIPSWGTREAEFVYTFHSETTGQSHSYTVDQKSYNHLILFPVFWVTFITLNEYGVYKDALTNFVENSEGAAAADRR